MAALGFGRVLTRTLVSMATDSSHMVIMEKTVLSLFLDCFSSDLFILAGNEDTHESSEEFEFLPGRPLTKELAVLERQKQSS